MGHGINGKRVVITGAAGDLGRALCHAFKAAGSIVIAADRALTTLVAKPDDVDHHVYFDLLDSKQIADVHLELQRLGPIDVLVNNAGYSQADTLAEVDRPTWDAEVAVNLTGVFEFTAPIARQMAERRSGAIVFISSVNALSHYGSPAYAAAKAGILAYMRSLSVELGASGVRANGICPGSLRSAVWDKRMEADPAIARQIVDHYPLGRLVEPSEVASAALFLASSASSGITGATLNVDNGLSAGNLPFFRLLIQP